MQKKDNQASIIGEWNIVSDSSYVGVGAGNHLTVYDGQPGDYFDFSSDGKLYIKKNGTLDTLYYNSTSNVTMTTASYPDSMRTSQQYTIYNLSAHNATITTGIFETQGGVFGRTVTLDR